MAKQWGELNGKEKVAGIAGLIFIAFVILAVVGAVTGGNKAANDAYQSTTPSTTTQTQNPQISQPAKPKEWVEVVTFSGDTKKRSAPFTLSGADARLKYTQTGGQYATAYVYIVKQGESLEEQGGFPEVTIEGNKTDETRLAKSAGSYYFDITSSSSNWTVTIEEYR